MSALEGLFSQLDENRIDRIAGRLGVAPEQAGQAIQAALPLLLGALQRNAQTPDGAAALHRAMSDHANTDGEQLLGNILGAGRNDSALSRQTTGGSDGSLQGLETGAGILRHVFGHQQSRAVEGVSRASGLGTGAAGQLMAMLAPLLMNALSRATQQRKVDPDGLAGMLGQETKPMNGPGGGLQQMLSKVLDSDGDGDLDVRDLMRHGATLFGAFTQMRGAGRLLR